MNAHEAVTIEEGRQFVVPNGRIEFAPFGRPTRKQLCCWLAAHPQRWA